MPYTIGIDARKALDFGIGTYIRNLIRGLAEIDSENRYVLLTGREGREALTDLPDNFQVVHERSRVYSVSELLTLSFRLSHLKLDLYHSTHYVLPLLVPCKVVATVHDIIHLLFPDLLPNRLALLYAQRMIGHTLSRADRIVTVSKNTKRDLLEHFEVEPGKIEVIYNGVEECFRQPLGEEQIGSVLAKHNLRRPYALFVGNPKPHKNLDNVVKAFAAAKQQRPSEAWLVCVGGQSEANFKIRQRAEQLGIADALKLIDRVDQADLPALYQGAEIFLYPTLYEGFGLPVAEAMASGTAVITSNTSALKELAEGYAYLVDPLDVPALAQAISLCLSEPERRAALARLGRERSQAFVWRTAAEATLRVYQQVLGGSAT